jgi:GT2 family glycosyltransferase
LEDKDLEIVVVSNGCKDGTIEYCRSLSGVKVLEFPDAIGYTKAINIGVQAAKGEYVVLLNNDTEIHGKLGSKDWIDCLYEPFENQTMVGATGAKKLHQFGVDFLVGFCLFMPKKLFSDFGMFDEVYNPGFGEEIQFSHELKKKGYQEITVNMPISHTAGQTVHRPEYREEWEEHVLRNSKILEERYGFSQWQ